MDSACNNQPQSFLAHSQGPFVGLSCWVTVVLSGTFRVRHEPRPHPTAAVELARGLSLPNAPALGRDDSCRPRPYRPCHRGPGRDGVVGPLRSAFLRGGGRVAEAGSPASALYGGAGLVAVGSFRDETALPQNKLQGFATLSRFALSSCWRPMRPRRCRVRGHAQRPRPPTIAGPIPGGRLRVRHRSSPETWAATPHRVAPPCSALPLREGRSSSTGIDFRQ